MVIPSLSLYDLIEMRSDEAKRLLAHKDYYKFVTSNEFRQLPQKFRVDCLPQLCEKMCRKFFWRWALEPLLEFTHQRLPILCCEKIMNNLKNVDLYTIFDTVEMNGEDYYDEDIASRKTIAARCISDFALFKALRPVTSRNGKVIYFTAVVITPITKAIKLLQELHTGIVNHFDMAKRKRDHPESDEEDNEETIPCESNILIAAIFNINPMGSPTAILAGHHTEELQSAERQRVRGADERLQFHEGIHVPSAAAAAARRSEEER
ncbi:unnamed protein product [Trichogramma brassicae]|uniref:Uncharacterized protein n=1 Tax=Trichogramma brassicae TaxID=86971 RepID=A0A6H5J7T7_9HYME|nr:unnamed protein product [Trichogramma brassicae]